jgi:hypothetical protein
MRAAFSSHGRQGGRERAQRYWDNIQTFAYSKVDPYSPIRICYDSQIRIYHAHRSVIAHVTRTSCRDLHDFLFQGKHMPHVNTETLFLWRS